MIFLFIFFPLSADTGLLPNPSSYMYSPIQKIYIDIQDDLAYSQFRFVKLALSNLRQKTVAVTSENSN